MPRDPLKHKAYCAAHYRAHKAEKAIYYQTHKAECNARSAAYYQAHKAEMAAYGAAYYQAHKAENAAHRAAYYQVHKAEILAQKIIYDQAHKAEHAAYRKAHKPYATAYRKAHKTEWAIQTNAHRRAHKMDVFNAYGGPKCACCGETLLEGLTIDHVNGDGAKHRKQNSIAGGQSFYRWLKKNGYPSGYQVLCGTCNMAKGTGDHCPHKDRPIA